MTNDTHFVMLAASGCIDATGCKKTHAAAYICNNTIVPGLGGQLCPVTCQCCRKHPFYTRFQHRLVDSSTTVNHDHL